MLNKLKPKNEFTRNVLTLMTGTTIAQAIPIAISPILTRLYTPEDFGVFALFVSITTILGSIANGKYELAIMLPKKDEDAINIVALGILITFIFSFIIFLLILSFHSQIVNLLNNKKISIWLYFIPFVVLLLGIFNVLNYWNNRKKYYKNLAKATIIKSIVGSITQLILGFFKTYTIGLVSGYIMSQIIVNLNLFFNIKKNGIYKISKYKIIKMMKKYYKFPKYDIIATLLDIGTLQIPIILLSKIYNSTMVGFYFFASKIVFLPSSLIASSIANVYFQKITETNSNYEKIKPIFYYTIKKLILISLPIFLVLFFLSPTLFNFFFGIEWEQSGQIAKYLSIIFFIRFIVSPLSSILSLDKYLYLGAIWKTIYFFSTILIFIITYEFNFSIMYFIYLYVIHEILLYTIYFILIYKVVNQIDKNRNYKCVE